MKKNNKLITEDLIIYEYLSKLNEGNKETFNFKNDGALLKQYKNKDIVVTNDSITEGVDFFINDEPESIAQKIVTCNLSDLSSMGSVPYAYTLSLCLKKNIGNEWLKRFIKKLFNLQKQYKFFLLGGDIGVSNQIHVSANFFGYVKKNYIIERENSKIGDSIWVTGNLGEYYIGLLVKNNEINLDRVFKKYFLDKYLFPTPSMIGSKIIRYANSSIDISDGFFGDLNKLLFKKIGADLNYSNIPFSKNAKILIKDKKIIAKSLLSGGDDYELIFTSNSRYDKKIFNLSKQNKLKITKVGRIINKSGIFIDGKKMLIPNNSFRYLF